jgi:hypothetical protein
MLARIATAGIALAAALSLGGCATRFDAQGNRIYVLQFGQDTQRDVDYSNPRLPILPKYRPSMELWPVPSPWQFNDLSKYSMLDDRNPIWSSPMLAALECPLPPHEAQLAPWGAASAISFCAASTRSRRCCS